FRKEVSTGPGFGVDVSVVDLPNGLAMALTSDPLSLIPSLGLEESAWLSVHLMANDMATTGHAPMYGQFVLNLPAHFSSSDFKIYWNYIHQFCKDIKLSITGGHTGFIEGQNSTIAGGGTFITVASKEKILLSKNAEVGNVILVTKQSAITSSAILAMSFPETVKNKLGKEIYERGCDLFYQSSSLKDALVAAEPFGEITAMHDVTEGGILGAIYEMAVASGNGALIDNSLLPLGEIQKDICKLFGIDPRFCVGAGSMIIAVRKGSEQKVIDRLQKEKIDCTVVGEFTPKENGIKLFKDGEPTDVPYFEKDPYWEAFFNAYKNGWK
ncbi:MAG TPA: AIR synthase-related protein, partial [Cyclobacteriaceae bacterium]|nr:AIR synthase-related protein [Cyclobacteriaceae bacterium]